MAGARSGWLKAAVLAGLVLGAAGCKGTEADIDDIYVPTAHYERHPIIVTKSGAQVKSCGNWPNDLTETSENDAFENFGCAHQNNIAAMVADPQDLVRPRKQAPSDAMRRSKIFDKYREGQATTAQQEAQQKVQISNVAGQ